MSERSTKKPTDSSSSRKEGNSSIPRFVKQGKGNDAQHPLNASTSSTSNRIQQPPFPHSSDSLLHHLHTDPQSSHITVCGAASPVAHKHVLPSEGATELVGELIPDSTNGLVSGKMAGSIGMTNPSSPEVGGESEKIRSSKIPKFSGHGMGLMGKPVDIFPPEAHSSSAIKRAKDKEQETNNVDKFKSPESPRASGSDSPAEPSPFHSNLTQRLRMRNQRSASNSVPGRPRGDGRPSTAPYESEPSFIPSLPSASNEASDLDSPSIGSPGLFTSQGNGSTTPGGHANYFDAQREKDRRGKSKIRAPGNHASLRSRTSTSSSLHLGQFPINQDGIAINSDGLPTPGSEGYRSMGTERDGDDELTGDEEEVQRWPAEDHGRLPSESGSDPISKLNATTAMMQPAVEPNVKDHPDGISPDVPSSSTGLIVEKVDDGTSHDLKSLAAEKDSLRNTTAWAASTYDMQDDTPTPTAQAKTSAHQSMDRIDDSTCLDQFVQQFQGAMQRKMEKDAYNNMSPRDQLTQDAVMKRSGKPTTLIGSAGQLDVDELADLARLQSERYIPQDSASTINRKGSSDWNLFLQAYSGGRWDPNRVPVPPRAAFVHEQMPSSSARSSPGASFSTLKDAKRVVASDFAEYKLNKTEGAFGMASYLTDSGSAGSSRLPELSSGSSGNTAHTGSTSAPPTSINSDPPRLDRHSSTPDNKRRWTFEDKRGGLSESFSGINAVPSPASDGAMKRTGPGQISLAGGAATMMLASQGYHGTDFEPLGMPSPERELLDPLASAMNSESGAGKPRKSSTSSDTSAYRPNVRSKMGTSSSTWDSYGSLNSSFRPDVLGTMLSTIAASPATTPNEYHPDEIAAMTNAGPPVSMSRKGSASSSRRSSGSLSGLKRIPPASAPIDWQSPKSMDPPTDYFGDAVRMNSIVPASPSSSFSHQQPPSTSRTSSSQTITKYSLDQGTTTEDSAVVDSDEEQDESTTRRPSLANYRPRSQTPQSSHVESTREAAVRPAFSSYEAPARLDASMRDLKDVPLYRVPEKTREEKHFEEKGYLLAPIPSNDAQRRKALYRFKLLHTSQDVNFDRIAHLAKLVFSTRIVLISLVDENYNWHKVDFGLGAETAERGDSFCSHVILAKNDEPLVVLDTHADWRFKQHPFVLGGPKIRFYAGAPLRTAEGYNVGSLCIIDPQPRSEFPPRSRMALKEFAGVVVREMELWRDKTRLKARDRIQTSMERFTRECLELDNTGQANAANPNGKMEKVYERASSLVRRTLELDGAMVLDLSQFESVEVTDASGAPSMVYQADPYDMGSMASEDEHHRPHDVYGDATTTFGPLPPWSIMGAAEVKQESLPDRTQPASSSEHARFSEFLKKYPEGRIYEQVVPSWIRHFLPQGIQYAMIVPIFNIDKHPFALLCAYTCNQAKQFLEGYELQFLRAIGVVILSAVLKKRMVLADKAKSNFISNISHELRTPLHGILAAAELLQDTQLDVNQTSFLSTVQACGNSLIETVNHVLDFTKLSGNTKASIENVIKPGSVDLAHLVEETVEGCWIGQRARAQQGQSEIGSFYSPPSPSGLGDPATKEQVADRPYVETVIDIGFREKGWQVRCEKGGIRRVLMNLIGNSLKFTRDGYIQVTLRELPHTPGSCSIPVEMAVIDTGKGISRDFLKDQLFHPFSQENPLQTGTGLGLAIVNSIVRSESVNGKVDVWSSEGLGTEIKISLNVDLETGEISDEADPHGDSVDQALPWNEGAMFGKEMTVSMANFRLEHRGSKLNQELVASYLQWWAFELLPDDSEELGEVIIADEEGPLLRQLLERNDTSRAVLILSTSRVPRPSSAMSAYQKAGGFVQMVFKPVGPERLQAALRAGVKALTRSTPSQETTRSVRSDYFSPPLSPHRPRSPSSEISWRSSRPEYQRQGGSIAGSVTGSIAESITDSIDEAIRPSVTRESTMSTIGSPVSELPIHFNPMARRLNGIKDEGAPGLLRRRSEEDRPLRRPLQRPGMTPRSTTFNDVRPSIHSIVGRIRGSESGDDFPSVPGSPNSTVSTVSLADGGVMLKKAAAPTEVILEHRKPRILLVDDNHINLQLLSAYLKKRGIEFKTCLNGQISLDAFKEVPVGHWDIILMDMSMPVMDGIDATRAIRRVETDRRAELQDGNDKSQERTLQQRCKIFALSGRATAEDKKLAFAAGVDGYLVKPVKLATLDTIMKRLGF